MRSQLSRALFAFGALCAAAPAAAHAQTPRVIQADKAEARGSANRPDGTKISCNRPGGRGQSNT